jgi:hypothetical protein
MKKTVDLRRYPYRGILKEMEAELGIPTPQIHSALFRSEDCVPNPRIAEMFNRKLEERQQLIKTLKKNLRKAV